MIPNGEVFTPTDTVPFLLNTNHPSTGEAVTWGSAGIRLMRYRGTTWTEIVDDVGYTLDTDWDPSASPRTGLHVGAVDLDGLTNVAESGDLYAIIASAGTVETENMINLALAYFWVQVDGLTAQQKADVEASSELALQDFHGTYNVVVQASPAPTVTTFDVDINVGSDERTGFIRALDGALAGESRPAKHTGTSITVEGAHANMPTNWKEFSAAPASGVTMIFTPIS